MIFFVCNVLSANTLTFVSINYQECKIRSEIIGINSNEPPLPSQY